MSPPQTSTKRSRWDKAGRTVPLFVAADVVAKSVHAAFDCTGCHEDFDADAIPHKQPMTRVDCASCHEEPGASHAFHPRLAQTPQLARLKAEEEKRPAQPESA